MKKILTAVVVLATTMIANAQFYTSVSGGYAWGVPSTKIGEENINGNQKVLFGTYGEGLNAQLRFGYFFNQTWGIDVSTGYLHGAKQTVLREEQTKYIIPQSNNVKAQAKAYGLALSVIYNFTENFYGRFGLLTKIGGKTEVKVNAVTNIEGADKSILLGLNNPIAQKVGSTLPDGVVLQKGSQIEVSYTEDFKGKMPFGTIAALGYKYNLTDKLSLFGEIEYMNIAVKRDYSTRKDIKAEITLVTPAGTNKSTLDNNTLRLPEKITYVDELPADNTDASKQLTEKASYSSLGLNVGITYSF